MTRGRPPLKGLEVAIPIARDRGRVMEVVQTADNLCEFVVIGNGVIALVRVRKARSLHGVIARIESDFSSAVTEARTIPCGGPVSRELWLYSRFGVLRFFRILDARIVELDRLGVPLLTGPERPGEPVTAGTSPGAILPGEMLPPTVTGSPAGSI